MDAAEILFSEHRIVWTALARLQASLAPARRAGVLDPEATEEMLSFFELWVDDLHQDKEERVFFPRLIERAAPREARHVERLLHEHADERRTLGLMRSNAMGAAWGEPRCLEVYVENAEAYVDAQRRHLGGENVVLLPLAQRLLDEETSWRIVRGFQALEEEWCGQFTPWERRRLESTLGRLRAEAGSVAYPFDLHV